jgi:hypothetical protein
MGYPRLRSNKPLPYYRCTGHQHCTCYCTPHCPPSERRQGTIYAHLHLRPRGGSIGSYQFLRRGQLGRNWGDLLDFAPISRRILAAWRWWDISGILGRFWCAVIGTPIFFCFNHRSRNAVHPTALGIRCASAAHPLRIRCASAATIFEGLKPL